MVQRTAGHELAWRELLAIARASAGAVSVGQNPAVRSGYLLVTLTVSCVGTPHTPSGVSLADREVFRVAVPPDFPWSQPSVDSTNIRFAGQPHVMWTNT